jgi:hypothetical protein
MPPIKTIWTKLPTGYSFDRSPVTSLSQTFRIMVTLAEISDDIWLSPLKELSSIKTTHLPVSSTDYLDETNVSVVIVRENPTNSIGRTFMAVVPKVKAYVGIWITAIFSVLYAIVGKQKTPMPIPNGTKKNTAKKRIKV